MRKILLLLLGTALFLLPQAARGERPVLVLPEVIKGLESHAEVLTDPFGIPHIYAQNIHDLYFLTGYLHARDRLFQMDVTRRQASGTLAELLGQEALKSDLILRTLGLRRAAELSFAALSPEALAELQAYADGVNYYIEWASAAGKLPPEYAALEISKVEPWTPLDSLVIGKAICFQLSFDLDIENTLIFLAYREAFGGLVANALFHEDLFRSAPADPAAAVPDALGLGEAARAELGLGAGPNYQVGEAALAFLDPRSLALALDYYDRIKGLEFFKPILNRRHGSNWFIISGRNTTNGYPLLANDPHLDLSTPSVWYEIHQQVEGELNVIGVGFPGIPLVILGHNERIVWGATTNPMDVTDTFQEKLIQQDGRLYTYFRGQLEPIQMIPETFKVNLLGDGQLDNVVPVPPDAGVPQATLIVPRHGPIINLDLASGTALSVQYTGFYATRELETFRIWNRAGGLDEFKEGLKYFDFGSQNWAYADVEGNIAYFTSGELPLREDLEQGLVDGAIPPWFIRDGTGAYRHQWLPEPAPSPDQATPYKVLPFEEMPQIVNPPSGFVVNANNDPIGNTLDNNPLNQLRPTGGIFYLNYTYDMGFRAGRITELIRQALGRKISLEDLKQFQGDVLQLEGRRLAPYILQAYEAAQRPGAPESLARFAQEPKIKEAISFLQGWSYKTPTGVTEGFDYEDAPGALAPPTEEEIRDSIATTIFNLWISRFVRKTLDAALDSVSPRLPKPSTQFAVKALLNLLDGFALGQGFGKSGLSFFLTPEVGLTPEQNRDLLILESLKEALDLLAGEPFAAAFNRSTDLKDYRWGKLHRAAFPHLLPPFTAPPIPTDGSRETVDVASFDVRADEPAEFIFSHGPSRRYVAEVRPDGIQAFNVIPGGESGVPGTKHFGDQLPLWLANDYHPLFFTDHEVRGNAESYQDFYPLR
ncbi:MAG: penicillin acylase family protein [Candidatus Bipolaricaulia bacterium]